MVYFELKNSLRLKKKKRLWKRPVIQIVLVLFLAKKEQELCNALTYMPSHRRSTTQKQTNSPLRKNMTARGREERGGRGGREGGQGGGGRDGG